VEIRVLGPVELYAHGRQVDLGPRKRRFVLAVLALEVNRLVPVERLIELTWPDGAPRTAAHAIQVCVSRLRSVLAGIDSGDHGVEITTRGSGYLLRADPAVVDARRFWTLLEQAGTAGDDNRRIAALTQALDLWHGPALSGAAPMMTRERLCYGLEEARLAAIEDRLDAQLRLGRHRAVLAELAELAQAHPTRERPLAQLMLALYRTGRVSEALDVYRRARYRLAEEFGLDPGAELSRLELAILRDDPALRLPNGSADHPGGQPPFGPPPGGQPPLPRHLPPDVHAFTGRRSELAALDERLLLASVTPSTVLISTICGTGGVGKTTLAVHWAHGVAAQFPDGQLYVNLRGFDPTGSALDPAEAIRGFLDAFGVPVDQIPDGLAAQTGLYRSLLAGKRVLVILDNARDVEQVRPLLPGSPGCLAIVTSRNQLTPLVATEGAHPVTLDLLTPADARDLLSRRLGIDRVASEPDAVDDIVARCARLPLALAIVGARAATNPDFPLAVLAGELRATTAALDAFHGGDPATDLRTVFSWSYHTLDTDGARLFRLLGLHPGPDISPAAAASLAAVPLHQVRPLLAGLTRAHLLTEHTPGRYSMHDLLRAYAIERAHDDETEDARHAAVHRMLDHYLHTAHTADMLLDPRRGELAPAAPLPGVAAERPAGHDDALAWFDAEYPVLLAAIDQAVAAGLDVHTWQLACAFGTYLLRRGHWHQDVAVQHTALDAARRLDDRVGQARACCALATASLLLGRLDDADTYYRHELAVCTRFADPAGQARAHIGLACVAEQRGDLAGALAYARRALDLYDEAGDRIGQATSRNSVGWLHAQLGDHQQAIAYCQQALTALRELGYRAGEASTWDSLGYAHRGLADYEQAIACYQRSLDLCREIGDRYNEADELASLGDTHHVAGNAAAARQAWQHALTILDELNHPHAARVRTRLHPATDPSTLGRTGGRDR
jgi:DNA-binding SARP family transcriptional activator